MQDLINSAAPPMPTGAPRWPGPERSKAADMRELVREAEPKVIQTIVTQPQADDRSTIGELQCGAIKVGAR